MRRYLFEDLTEEGISEELVELIEQKPVVIDISLKLAIKFLEGEAIYSNLILRFFVKSI